MDIKEGETHTLGYRYKIPVYAPAFYTKGPLKLTASISGQALFSEARKWQLAADAVDITFTEMDDVWTDSASGWELRDLFTYGVPANSIAEVSAGHNETNGTETMGVREVGSSQERSLLLSNAESGGEENLVLTVNTDSSSDIYTRNSDTTEDEFMLLGYWSGGTYVETEMTDLDEPSGGAAAWSDLSLSGNGLDASDVAEIVVTNANSGGSGVPREVGVRENIASPETRLVDIRKAEDGGVTAATMLVQADNTTSANIETYEEVLADNNLYLAGYWSDPPGRYQDDWDTLSAPGSDDTWTATTVSPAASTNVADIMMLQGNDSFEQEMGARVVADSGTAGRRLDVQEAEGGGRSPDRMHATVNGSTQVDPLP